MLRKKKTEKFMSDLSISPLSSPILDASRASSIMNASRAASAKGPREKLAVLNLPGSGDSPDALDAALEEFQNMLVKEMVKTMRASVPESSLFDKSSGERIFESMLDEKYAESFRREGGSLGLTEAIKEQFKPRRSYFDRPDGKSQGNPVPFNPAIPNILMKGDDHSE